jgi:hypothetical protein
MKSIQLILLEAIVFGLILILVALPISKLPLPPLINNPMIDGIFYTGLATHLILEFTGVNLWYAKIVLYFSGSLLL